MIMPADATHRRLYLSAVLELWNRGFDTFQIAKTLKDDQATVERALHEALEIIRQERRR
jgi:hypothetical protein